MKTRTILAGLAVTATATALLAQQENNMMIRTKDADGAVMLAQGPVGMIGFSGEPGNVRFVNQEFSFNGRTVTGQPYSADEKTESVQTLADGNRITNTTTAHIYRDSQGRTRREITLPGMGGDQSHTIISISDPASGTSFSFDKDRKVAHQMPGMPPEMRMKLDGIQAKLKAEAEVRTSVRSGDFIHRAPAPNVKHEELGENMLEGVRVTGTMETSTIEAGAMGNERPIEIKSERWYSPELQLEVKSVHNDPRMGQTTHTLTNIVRAEPDASLFQVPADYNKEGISGSQTQRFEYHVTN